MSYCLRILYLFCITAMTAHAGEWKRQFSQVGVNFYSVHFASKTLGLAVGRGVIYRTSDGGAHWDSIPGDFPALFHVRFIDEGHVWASGNRGTILFSSDGGLTWIQQKPETDSVMLRAFPISVSHVFATSSSGNLYKSTDGGMTWTKHPQNFHTSDFGSVFFTDDRNGWLKGIKKLWKTTDAGVTWTEQNALPGDELLYDMFFLNKDIGWVVGTTKTVFKTTDGGANWQSQQAQIPYGPNLLGIQFFDEERGWIVGNNFDVSSIAYTSDGGKNWTYQKDLAGNVAEPYDLHFIDPDNGWIVGSGFIISNSDVVSGVEENPEALFHKFTVNKTSLVFSAGIAGEAAISVSNLAGEEMIRLVKEDIRPGEDISLDISGLPSGIYFLSLGTGEKVCRRQFSILR